MENRKTGASVPQSRQGQIFSSFAAANRPILGPTQPPIQWVSGTVLPAVKRPEPEGDQLQLVPRLKMCGALLPLPQNVFIA